MKVFDFDGDSFIPWAGRKQTAQNIGRVNCFDRGIQLRQGVLELANKFVSEVK